MVSMHGVRRQSALAAFVFALAPGGSVAAATQPALPPCASIPVELLDAVDSGKVHIGDSFRFRAIDTVTTSDRITIANGTIGYGLVEYASAAAAHAKPGQLVLEARYFSLPHRKQYQVSVDAAASTELHSGSTGNAPGIVGAVPVPFMGVAVGAFNYFHPGKNVTVPVGYRFAVAPVGELSKVRRCRPELEL